MDGMEFAVHCNYFELGGVFMFGLVYDQVCFGRMSHSLGENYKMLELVISILYYFINRVVR